VLQCLEKAADIKPVVGGLGGLIKTTHSTLNTERMQRHLCCDGANQSSHH
jgi:hypothetical protein